MKDLLKYYIALQPFFRERMGPIAEGDHVSLGWFDSKSFDIGFVTQTKTMEADIISADLIYVRWYSEKPWRDQSCDKRDWAEEHFIRLPHTIDDSSEEARKRSLIGMVKYFIRLSVVSQGYFQIWVKDTPPGTIYDGSDNLYFLGATPTEAILKALCHQEGVEVE